MILEIYVALQGMIIIILAINCNRMSKEIEKIERILGVNIDLHKKIKKTMDVLRESTDLIWEELKNIKGVKKNGKNK